MSHAYVHVFCGAAHSEEGLGRIYYCDLLYSLYYVTLYEYSYRSMVLGSAGAQTFGRHSDTPGTSRYPGTCRYPGTGEPPATGDGKGAKVHMEFWGPLVLSSDIQ